MTTSAITELLSSIIAMRLEKLTSVKRSEYAHCWISVGNQLTERDPEAALLAFDEAIRVDPSAWGAYNNRALIKTEQGRYADAIDDCDIAISAHPERALLYLSRARAKLELKLYEESITDYSTVIHLAPDWAVAHAQRGSARYRMGQHDLAIQDLDRAIQLDTQYTEGYLNRGAVREGIGQLEEACLDYDIAIKLDPCLVQAYYSRGNVKSAMGQLEEAVVDYSNALSLEPNHVHAYVNRGVAKRSLGHPEEAIRDHDLAIHLMGDDSLAYMNRGNANSDVGRVKQAIRDYEKAIELEPINAPAYQSLGIEKMKLRQYQSALDDHRRALELEPENAEYHALVGICNAELGQESTAIKDLDRAVELDGASANVYCNRGYVRGKLGLHREALDDYGKAIELEPQTASLYFARAKVLEALEKTGPASEDKKLGQEIWKSDLDRRMLRETCEVFEGGNKAEIIASGLYRVERIISLFVELLHDPQEEHRGRVSVFRYKDENVETAMILKMVQALSTLNARKKLLELGFVTEQGMLFRVYQEIIEDILFLASGIILEEVSSNHEKYLEEFYRDSIDEDGNLVKGNHRWLPRKTIWKHILKRYEKAGSDGMEEQGNAEGLLIFLQSIHRHVSGYVHTRAHNIMQMYDSEGKLFRMCGKHDGQGEEKTDIEVLELSLEMLIGCAACVGKVLGGQTWYDCIWKLRQGVTGDSNL